MLICITGPTAVGKSDIAIKLAQKLGWSIVSADSMQIYKYMDIGTAKPTKEEQAIVKHYMIDICEPDESYNAYLFAKEADRIIKQEKNVIIVGGTGLYFESLIYGLDYPTDDKTMKYREELYEFYETHGADALHAILEKKDIDTANKVHKNNIKSVIRALEILEQSPIVKRERKSKYDYKLFAINSPRDILYDKINKRVEIMEEKGLIDEVKFLASKYDTNSQAFHAIGYKEILEYFEGKHTKEEAIDLIKQHSRNYAKRQITFIKRLNPIWLESTNIQEVINKILFVK